MYGYALFTLYRTSAPQSVGSNTIVRRPGVDHAYGIKELGLLTDLKGVNNQSEKYYFSDNVNVSSGDPDAQGYYPSTVKLYYSKPNIFELRLGTTVIATISVTGKQVPAPGMCGNILSAYSCDKYTWDIKVEKGRSTITPTVTNPVTTTNPILTTPTSFKVGDTITITPNFLGVYSNPDSGFLGYQAKGQTAVILEGPVKAGEYNWYKLDYTFGADGWSVEKFSKLPGTEPVINNVTGSANTNFSRNLTVGMEGEDVKALQQFLNRNGFTIANSGAGSPGNETTYYGEATASALARFQTKYASETLAPIGLTTASGYFGELTRAKVRAMSPADTNTSTTPSGNPTLDALLKQVQELQAKLNALLAGEG